MYRDDKSDKFKEITMSILTQKKLAEALGSGYKLEEDKVVGNQIHIRTADGDYVAFLDLDSDTLEVELCAQWRDAESDNLPEDFPTELDCAEAGQEIAEELQPDWEIAGFTVSDDKLLCQYAYEDDPDRELSKVVVKATYEVKSLEDAVKTINWIRHAETTTFVGRTARVECK